MSRVSPSRTKGFRGFSTSHGSRRFSSSLIFLTNILRGGHVAQRFQLSYICGYLDVPGKVKSTGVPSAVSRDKTPYVLLTTPVQVSPVISLVLSYASLCCFGLVSLTGEIYKCLRNS